MFPTTVDNARRWDRARFYTIGGKQWPSVTTVLNIIAKPALGPWYAREERRYFEAAMLEVLAKPGARDPDYVLSAVAEAVSGVKAADRAKQQAATIGTAMHAGIEWHLRSRLGEDAGPEPTLPDEALWAVESWKDWAQSVQLEPLAIERTIYCDACGYAGTLDLYARVGGVLSVLDWKSGKAIYPEAFLQNVAYRHAAARLGLPSAQGLIVRLPKLVEDPAWEVMLVPETVTMADFRAALSLWRWQRQMDGLPTGDWERQSPPSDYPVSHWREGGPMSVTLTDSLVPGGPWAAVARFLTQYPTESRAEALHLALQSLRARVEPDRVLACELAWEMHTHGYWSQVRRPDGGPYETEEAYFRDVLGLASWRTAYKRLAIGRMLMGFEEPERSQLRAAIAAVGLAKATVVVPAIERLREWKPWLEWAGQLPTVTLQEKVSAALEALPRGREPSPPGERFRRTVLAAMPDIEAMELVDRFFEVGAEVVGTPHPIGIFLAGCRECLGEWEVQATRWSRPTGSRGASDANLPGGAVCPHGQTAGANGEPGAQK